MITKSYLFKTLNWLDQLYNDPTADNQKTSSYSKLALIELCGWIEETMDDIVLRCAKLTKNSSIRLLAILIVLDMKLLEKC